MALRVPCPNCGWRPWGEFAWGGALRPPTADDVEEDFARVFLHENRAGIQDERWFHLLGCRRWITVTRDTTTNEFLA